MANIIFICYGQQLTGSKNIRGYNEIWGSRFYKNTLTPFGKYCKKYDIDLGKKTEPFFDYIAARIMTLDNDTFNKNFSYVPVTLSRENISVNSRNKSANNLIKTTPFTIIKGTTYTKFRAIAGPNEFKRDDNYINSKHIFIGGPITDESFDMIQDYIKNNSGVLYIHFQGESPTDKNGNPVIKNTAYLNPGGIFANAFNIQNSIYNYSRFRDLLKTHDAKTYTVIPETININEQYEGTLKGHWKGVPELYIQFYKDIEKQLTTNARNINNKNIIKLNITQIHQDIYDKDNYPSLMHLVTYSTNINNIRYFISGVPIFESKEKGRPIPLKYGLGLNQKEGYNLLDTTFHIGLFWKMWRSWSGNRLPIEPHDISIIKYYKTNKPNTSEIKPSAFHPSIFLSGQFYKLIGFETLEEYKKNKMNSQLSSIKQNYNKYKSYLKNSTQNTRINKIAIQKKINIIQHALSANNSHHLNSSRMKTAVNHNILNLFEYVKTMRKMDSSIKSINNLLARLEGPGLPELPSRPSSKHI